MSNDTPNLDKATFKATFPAIQAAFEKYSVDVVIECHTRLLDPEDLFLRSVDVMITEKCSLTIILSVI